MTLLAIGFDTPCFAFVQFSLELPRYVPHLRREIRTLRVATRHLGRALPECVSDGAFVHAEPLAEQTVLTRLVEAIRPQIPSGSMPAIVDAANGALDAWEQRDEAVRGPRVKAIDLHDGAVTMRRDR
ncbi:hypothetical protein [uncultured Methylobacterium sp.]|uniref:hypothetical protein n=1 Tax=uncultured Methylobacterium sp. TaxID=157278 RepID=UPI0035CC6AEB